MDNAEATSRNKLASLPAVHRSGSATSTCMVEPLGVMTCEARGADIVLHSPRATFRRRCRRRFYVTRSS